MAHREALTSTAFAVGPLLLLGVVVSLVVTIVGLVRAAVTAAATLLVVLGIAYVTVKGVRRLRGAGIADATSADSGTADPSTASPNGASTAT